MTLYMHIKVHIALFANSWEFSFSWKMQKCKCQFRQREKLALAACRRFGAAATKSSSLTVIVDGFLLP